MPDINSLSRQESLVLDLAAKGLLDKEISQELQISKNTIRTYWTRIRGKIGEQSRVGLVRSWLDEQMSEASAFNIFRRWEITFERGHLIGVDSEVLVVGITRHLNPERTSRYIHPDDFASFVDHLFTLIEGKETVASIQRRVIDGGKEYNAICLVRILRDHIGRPVNVLGYTIDEHEGTPASPRFVAAGMFVAEEPDGAFLPDDRCRQIFGVRSESPTREEFLAQADPKVAEMFMASAVGGYESGHSSTSVKVRLRTGEDVLITMCYRRKLHRTLLIGQVVLLAD